MGRTITETMISPVVTFEARRFRSEETGTIGWRKAELRVAIQDQNGGLVRAVSVNALPKLTSQQRTDLIAILNDLVNKVLTDYAVVDAT